METFERKNQQRRINEVVADALELNEDQRHDFILEQCRETPEIIGEIESMLSLESVADDFFSEQAAINYAGFLRIDDPEAVAGQQIGNYRIEREIGHGGMGTVYLAKRADDSFEQRVALKLLRRELNSRALRRRFQHERQILAKLQHPNIARLIDAGTTSDGIPFLAMEYIEGLPIDVFCDKENFDLNKRLQLFRVVCEAVAFAHRNLIVHRDLKPSNIIVTADGTPKLLDFGIAKLLTPEYEAEGEHTVTKLGAMTPNYASPEQLRLENVLTTSDVYSLGVILYELLSGRRPFESYESSMQKVLHAVCEIDPPPPSSVEAGGATRQTEPDEAPTIAIDQQSSLPTVRKNINDQTVAHQLRHTSPQFVFSNPQQLKGDIDNIILKALKKDPNRRYSSVEFFSEDVRRHLEGLPVKARPDTFFYRAEKFIKRHRAGVVTGIALLIVIAGGIIATLWQSSVARAERRTAESERARAERRFNDVRALANSFLFEISPKIETLPGSMPARRLLVTRALEYLDSLATESGSDEHLRSELAKAYEKVGDVQGNPQTPNVGDLKGALESYQKAQTIRREILENDSDNAEKQTDLAGNLEVAGNIDLNGGEFDKAEAELSEAVALREKILVRMPADFSGRSNLANALRMSGFVPFYNSENEKAMEFYRRSLAIFAQLSSEAPEDAFVNMQHANLYLDIGESFSYLDDAAQAHENTEKGVNMLAALYKKNQNNSRVRRAYLIALLKIAELDRDAGNIKRSAENYDRALELAQTSLQSEPGSFQARRDIVIANKQRAVMLKAARRISESIASFARAIEVSEQLRNEDTNNTLIVYDIAAAYQDMSELYYDSGDYQAAKSAAEKAQENCREVLAKNPAHTQAKTVVARSNLILGEAYMALAETSGQADLWRKALDSLRDSMKIYDDLKADGKFSASENKKVEILKTAIRKTEEKIGKK